MKFTHRNRSAFTLIELLVVLTIVAIIGALIAHGVRNNLKEKDIRPIVREQPPQSLTRSERTELVNLLREAAKAIEAGGYTAKPAQAEKEPDTP